MVTTPERVISKRLGELLLERKIINQNQLQEALQAQKKKTMLLGSILLLLGYATEEQIAQALTTQFGFPYLPLGNYEVDAEVVKLIPENVAKQYNLIAIDKIDNFLSVAVSDPLKTPEIKGELESLTGCRLRLFLSTPGEIEKSITQHYASGSRRME